MSLASPLQSPCGSCHWETLVQWGDLEPWAASQSINQIQLLTNPKSSLDIDLCADNTVLVGQDLGLNKHPIFQIQLYFLAKNWSCLFVSQGYEIKKVLFKSCAPLKSRDRVDFSRNPDESLNKCTIKWPFPPINVDSKSWLHFHEEKMMPRSICPNLVEITWMYA